MILLSIINCILAALPSATEVLDWEEKLRFFDIKLINVADFSELLVRLIFTTSIIFFVVHFLYRKNSKRRDFYFSYLAIGVIVFLLTFLLNSVKLELGFALGLFAIFGIIRYRTDTIPIKEMTYLFVIIGIAVINALSNKKVSYAELVMTNAIIVGGLWFLEKRLMLKQEGSVRIVYENITNIHMGNHDALLQDLIDRTGIEIKRFEIEKIDFLKDTAIITLYFNANGNGLSQKIYHYADDDDE